MQWIEGARADEPLDRVEWGATSLAGWFDGSARAANNGRAASTNDGGLARLGQQGIGERIASLPPPQREVLTLKFVCGLSNAEAAVVLGKSEAAVRALQRRALATLERLSSAGVQSPMSAVRMV